MQIEFNFWAGTGGAILASEWGELRALPDLSANLVEEGAEDVLLRGFEVILGENKSQEAYSRSNPKPAGRWTA